MSDYEPNRPPQDLIERTAKVCRCCAECSHPPCDGCMAGGMCDEARCSCDDEREDSEDNHRGEDGYDANACPGCGGSCQGACR